MNNLVKSRVIDFVQPARLEVVFLSVIRPSHRHQGMRDQRNVIAPADIDRAIAFRVDVSRDSLKRRQLAQRAKNYFPAEIERRNEVIEPIGLGDMPVAPARVAKEGRRQARARRGNLHAPQLPAQQSQASQP